MSTGVVDESWKRVGDLLVDRCDVFDDEECSCGQIFDRDAVPGLLTVGNGILQASLF